MGKLWGWTKGLKMETSNPTESQLQQESTMLKNPRDQDFWKMLLNLIQAVSAPNNEWLKFSYEAPKFSLFIRFSLTVFSPFIISSQIVYLVLNINQMPDYEFWMFWSNFPIAVLVVFKFYTTKAYDCMDYFLKNVHIYNFLGKNRIAEKELLKAERNLRKIVYVLLFLAACTWVLAFTGPVLMNHNNLDLISNMTMRYQINIYLVYPFEWYYNKNLYLIVQVISAFICFMGCFELCILDATFYAIFFHVMGHVVLLKDDIKWTIKHIKSFKDSKIQYTNITKLIKGYEFIKRSIANIEDGFGLNVAANYVFNLLVDSIIVFRFMTVDKENKYVYLMCLLFLVGSLILCSFVIEELRRKSEDISTLLYLIPWEDMELRCQKLFVPLLMRTQKPLIFEAYSCFETGVRPMIFILKSTFSYYVMLQTTVEN